MLIRNGKSFSHGNYKIRDSLYKTQPYKCNTPAISFIYPVLYCITRSEFLYISQIQNDLLVSVFLKNLLISFYKWVWKLMACHTKKDCVIWLTKSWTLVTWSPQYSTGRINPKALWYFHTLFKGCEMKGSS